MGAYMSKDPYASDILRTQDNAIKGLRLQNRNSLEAPALAAISDGSDEIVSIGKKITTRKVEFTEEDPSPDYLLPSNGGYNPKQKTMFLEEEEEEDVVKEQPKKVVMKKQRPLDYVSMMQKNIKQMRKIKGDSRQ
eukprot:CAMPEP_0185598072 /NCGR_PEP_ID=MMETSP0434-20130131/81772_1 /TAXON_ID=626734 ORGANISM="Favella taraikaensis, Strain Fe Narragansett Bay" /NCGR_SAMPLE_ID=MMETSP0434 /ASSEMBLY_ACC=CAM_ASM_000379 /LENGTH=134 /DNA_ID=CAMNT_0028226969 /DNA_START=1367 /DNA_END=1768 /DNA_ORIENTATION=-